jgi:hypothetical protein
MQGPTMLWQGSGSQEQRGLIPRTFEYLFARIAQEAGAKVPPSRLARPGLSFL